LGRAGAIHVTIFPDVMLSFGENSPGD